MLKNADLIKEFMVRAANPVAANLAVVISPDCEIQQSMIHPYLGIYKGIEGAADFFRIVHETYQIDYLKVENAFENEFRDAIVLECIIRGLARTTGTRFDPPSSVLQCSPWHAP